jgi:hypothetical protein
MSSAFNSEGQSYENLRRLREIGRPALDDPVKIRSTAQDMVHRGCRIETADQFLQRYRQEAGVAPRPQPVDLQGRPIIPEDREADQMGWKFGMMWSQKKAEAIIRRGDDMRPSEIAEKFRNLRRLAFHERAMELFPDRDFYIAWETAANLHQFILDVLSKVVMITTANDRQAN